MQIVRRAGVFMGANLNLCGDALDLSRFDWEWGLKYVRARSGQRSLAGRMATDHYEALRRHLDSLGDKPPALWGWKHPHSYLLLPFLRRLHPGLRFVHVLRDGRDMAFSANQRQVRHYGPVALGAGLTGPAPVRSAAYWACANALAAEDCDRELDGRYLRVRFEDLCADPETAVRRLVAFIGVGTAAELVTAAVREVCPPASIGRWRGADRPLAAAVTKAARPALRRFGYLDD
jgi:hypothetical protein